MVINKNSKGRCRKHPQGSPLLERREMSEEYDSVREQIAKTLFKQNFIGLEPTEWDKQLETIKYYWRAQADQILKTEGIRIEAADKSLSLHRIHALFACAVLSNPNSIQKRVQEILDEAGFVKCLPKPK